MRILNRLIASTAVVASLLAFTAVPALAATPNFGSHVRDCAQEMGLNGTMNPGMHRGAAGWDGESVR